MLHSNTNTTASQKRPGWIEKAALAVAALYGAERTREHVHATEAKVKTDAQETQEKIADIIHRHFQEHK